MSYHDPEWNGVLALTRSPALPSLCGRYSYARFTVAACQGTVLVLMGTAGVWKFFDLEQFASDLDTWTHVPQALRSLAIWAVPAAEMGLACAWLCGWRRSALSTLAAALLAMYVVVALVHSHLAVPPRCGCFGLMDQYFIKMTGVRSVALRSGGLLALLLLAWAIEHLVAIPRNTRPDSVALSNPTCDDTNRNTISRVHGGFTSGIADADSR